MVETDLPNRTKMLPFQISRASPRPSIGNHMVCICRQILFLRAMRLVADFISLCGADVHVASFFSLHRPISVTTTVPPPSNSEAFDSIFSSKKSPKQAQQDVMYTLSSAVESMETAAHEQADQEGSLHQFDSEGNQFDTMNMPDVKVSVEEMARQFLPFHPPPAPVPVDESKDTQGAESAHPNSKGTSSYSTVLTIRESTQPDGRTTYEAHTTPFVRSGEMEAPGATESDMVDPHGPGSTYIERLRHSRMQAMSTKRRRRIKMKKHKWKKRLRLTRSIRQKLDKT